MFRKTWMVMAAVWLAASGSQAGELRGRIATPEKGGAVVWLEGIQGEVPHQETTLTHLRGGAFRPYVAIGFVGNDFVFRNEDGRMHNVHLNLGLGHHEEVSGRALLYGATLYNIAQPEGSEAVRRPIKPYHRYRDETGVIEVTCDPHPQEHAFILVFDHPFVALTADDGSFSIPNLPAGSHPVRYWQGGKVADGGVVEVRESGVTEVVVGKP